MWKRLKARIPAAALPVSALLALVLGGCEPSRNVGTGPELVTASVVSAGRNDVITRDPARFSQALRDINNENEILIWVRNTSTPPLAVDALRNLPLDAAIVAALPRVPPESQERRTLGQALASEQANTAVVAALAEFRIEPYGTPLALPVYAVRVPDSVLVPVLTSLMNHPNVDLIEANQKRLLYLDAAPPIGSNPTDLKHDMHNVEEAWDYTRGEGVWIGILDTGVPVWHEDGLFPGGYGIRPFGFVDDYPSCFLFFRQWGMCEPRDDYDHGTGAVGIVGENDNDIGYVGIAPFAIVTSMKITFNTYVTGTPCETAPGPTETCYGDDDFVAAVNYAMFADFDVMSMSFSGDFGASVYWALREAYYTDDILLLSSTGNRPEQEREPQSWAFVMGVGAVTEEGDNYGNEEYQEVSGLWRGMSLRAYCPHAQFCVPDGYGPFTQTSAATAIAAGIAGLVRAQNPSWSAPYVRQRLIATSYGPHNMLDALAAVAPPEPEPLSATIRGPTEVPAGEPCTWWADVSGGRAPYTYQWSGVLSGTESEVFGALWSSGWLYLQVNSDDGQQSNDQLYITVSSGGEPPEECVQ